MRKHKYDTHWMVGVALMAAIVVQIGRAHV